MFRNQDDDEDLLFLGGAGGSPAQAPVAPAKPAADPELELLQKQSDDAQNQKLGVNLAGSLGDILGSGNGFGNYFSGKLNGPSTAASSFAGKVAGGIEDPMDKASKAAAYMKSKREAKIAAESDAADSGRSKNYGSMLSGVFPQYAKYFDGKSEAELDKLAPILMQKVRADEDRKLREAEMSGRREDRQLAREDKLDAKKLKQQELSSTQAKQRGLYEIGQTAEKQFNNAVADKNNYDPTSVGQVIDNSEWAPNWMKNNKAIESQAAQSAWVEGFLRDASGAAIPPSERLSYAKDFFPQPGDTQDVVDNKAQLRAQKMENARIAAGVETGHGPETAPIARAQTPAPSPLKTAIQEEKARRARLKNTAAR